jgi:L-seryl-tRNA(Ser) seleniumtransferase
LRVHPSNFRIEGFTERPSLADYVALGRKFNLTVAEDLGSGHLAANPPSHPLATEPAVDESIAAGVDVCCFSGDKLLGGPQAGIIVGRAGLIARIRAHPLMRALRVDKMTYAALEATLTEYAAGRASATIPIQRMLSMTADQVHARASVVASALGAMTGWRADVIQGVSATGGGSAPGVELSTWLVAIEKDRMTPDALEEALRRLAPPIIARIEHDRVVLDLRTVGPEQDGMLVTMIQNL